MKYGYQVDRSNPNAKSAFTVKYVTANGTVVHTADIQDVFPEDTIAAAPVDVYGFRYLSGSITAGNTADDTDGHLVSAVQGGFDSNGRFTGTMPNQPVEITSVSYTHLDVYKRQPLVNGYACKAVSSNGGGRIHLNRISSRI